MNRYFLVTFEKGYTFYITEDGTFPSIKKIREQFDMTKSRLYSIFEFKSEEDFISAKS